MWREGRRRNQVWKMMRYEKLVQLIWTSSRIPVEGVTKCDGRSAVEETEKTQKNIGVDIEVRRKPESRYFFRLFISFCNG